MVNGDSSGYDERGLPKTATALLAGLLILVAGCASFRHGWRRSMDSHCTQGISQFQIIQRNPDRYMGSLQAFRGDIAEAREVGGSLILKLFIRDRSSGYDTSLYHSIMVVAPDSFNIPIAAGDKDVYVLGRIANSLSGDKSFGPQVDAFSLQMAAIKSEKGMWFEPSEKDAHAYWRECE
ncbi:MAG: hypothetical protein ABII00_11380 [Elusimicrobiota bacterium]